MGDQSDGVMFAQQNESAFETQRTKQSRRGRQGAQKATGPHHQGIGERLIGTYDATRTRTDDRIDQHRRVQADLHFQARRFARRKTSIALEESVAEGKREYPQKGYPNGGLTDFLRGEDEKGPSGDREGSPKQGQQATLKSDSNADEWIHICLRVSAGLEPGPLSGRFLRGLPRKEWAHAFAWWVLWD